MYIKRNISTGLIFRFAWKNLIFFTLYAGGIFSAYYFFGIKFLHLPFQPLSVIGIAVSFYLGFKNNQSYDRFWEGRKIWGGIVNYSRTWANQVMTVVEADHATKQDLIYRQIAWINALRMQLRRPSSFSLVEKNKMVERMHQKHRDAHDICETLDDLLPQVELNDLETRKNVATHLVKNQGLKLQQLLKEDKITEFDKQMLHGVLEEFYNLQGKCERIKNTPFPRQYAYFSTIFTWIFILLLPFGLMDVFEQSVAGHGDHIHEWMMFLMVPFSVLISWVFSSMDAIGSNSEDPFENRLNDVPMTALCRTIEIDLRDMLDEKELPAKIQPIDNILY